MTQTFSDYAKTSQTEIQISKNEEFNKKIAADSKQLNQNDSKNIPQIRPPSSEKKIIIPSNELDPVKHSGKSIEDNLKKALQNQKGNNEVTNFLINISLPQYINVFQENGFDDMEILIDINTKYLVDMKIPAGHQIKIMKNIEKLRQEFKPNQPKLSDINVSTSKPNDKISLLPGKPRTDLVELEPPTHEMAIGDDEPISNQINDHKSGYNENLGAGEFNEAESHKYFIEALKEFRGTEKLLAINKNEKGAGIIKSIRPESGKTKSVRFSQDTQHHEKKGIPYISSKQSKKANKTNFLMSGGDTWNLGGSPSNKDSSTAIDSNEM